MSPLHVAAEGGHLCTVHLLLCANADCDGLDADSKTPLQYAAQNGSLQIVQRLLLAHADPNKSVCGYPPLHAAASKGHLQVVRHLVEASAQVQEMCFGETALHAAVEQGHIAVASYLLEMKAPQNARKDGRTPLCVAARSKNLEMVRLLTPNAMDLTNPLHIAADHGHLAILQCLLEARATRSRVAIRTFWPTLTLPSMPRLTLPRLTLPRLTVPRLTLPDISWPVSLLGVWLRASPSRPKPKPKTPLSPLSPKSLPLRALRQASPKSERSERRTSPVAPRAKAPTSGSPSPVMSPSLKDTLDSSLVSASPVTSPERATLAKRSLHNVGALALALQLKLRDVGASASAISSDRRKLCVCASVGVISTVCVGILVVQLKQLTSIGGIIKAHALEFCPLSWREGAE
ncbi:unnamed protein product [Effrenium voratum]|nr:unnamed protein product [Effrenium voratum]